MEEQLATGAINFGPLPHFERIEPIGAGVLISTES
jgi:hypothetical protein